MPETEPTPWELMRLMRQIDGKLDQVVTKDMFQAESRRVDERLDEQGRDIADERTARAEAVAAERAARKEDDAGIRAALETFKAKVETDAEKAKAAARWLAGGIALPIVLYVVDWIRG
jgi:hypothetical protein